MSVNRTDVNRVPGVSSTSISFDQPSNNIRREYISRSYSSLCTPYTYTELSCELTIVSFFFFFFVYIPRLYCKKKKNIFYSNETSFPYSIFQLLERIEVVYRARGAPRFLKVRPRANVPVLRTSRPRASGNYRFITLATQRETKEEEEAALRQARAWRKINWKTHGVLRMPHPPSRS